MANNIILKGARVIDIENNVDEILDIEIIDDKISRLSPDIDKSDAFEVIDLTGKIVSTGLIDMHCHLREPGFEYKETIETGSKSAIAGGYTGICPMANTNPVADCTEIINFVKNKAKNINIYPICAITKGLEGKKTVDFAAIKAIAYSDDGKPLEDMNLYAEALRSGNLIISHAETSSLGTSPESEIKAIERELELLEKTGGRIHFAHISTRKSVELIRDAKTKGLKVTCECAPHHFTFTQDDVTQNSIFKMNPPLRHQADLQAIIDGLKDNTIDAIATDHAPHSIEEKLKPFNEGPFGIVGFETALGLTLKKFDIKLAIEKLSAVPARILGLDIGLKIGNSADLTVIDPDFEWVIEAQKFKSKCKISPFEGQKVKGKAIMTIIKGVIYDNR